MKYIQEYIFDINRCIHEQIRVKQNDNARWLKLTLYKDNNPFDLTNYNLKFSALKPDGTHVFNTVYKSGGNKGICSFQLTSNMLSVPGLLKGEINIYESSSLVSTMDINIFVEKSLRDDSAIESSDEFNAVTEQLSKVEEWNKYFEETSGKIEEKYTHRLNDIQNEVSRIDWFSASNTLTNGSYPGDIILDHLAYQGTDQSLIVMVNITSNTDSNPVMMDNSRVKKAIDDATAKGVKTVMLKPHLGINWSDGTERYNLKPDDMTTMLMNWKAILLNYAKICNDNNIPVLCIGCEQRSMTVSAYAKIWQNIVDEIKIAYPKLKLTYAADSVEGVQYSTSCIYTLDGLDYIGLNLYPQWYKEEYNSNLTYRDIMPSAYYSYAPTGEGFKFNERINYIKETFNKDTYITEIGVMPFNDGLITLKSTNANDSTAERNYNVPAICYESVFNTLAKNQNVVGISLWHTKFPFSYFDTDGLELGESPAEEIVKKYVERGDLVERV